MLIVIYDRFHDKFFQCHCDRYFIWDNMIRLCNWISGCYSVFFSFPCRYCDIICWCSGEAGAQPVDAGDPGAPEVAAESDIFPF